MKRVARKPQVKKKKAPGQARRARPQSSAGPSIARGLASIADQFIPGAGMVARGVGKLFGYGAYTAEEAQQLLASKVPTMNATMDHGVRISHHEYLGDVSSSTGFTNVAYPLNPGVAATFPFLSQIAQSFQEYEFVGVCFMFKSTSASALNSTNTALGQVIGAVLYNPYAPAPTSKLEMLAISSARDGKPSESNLYPVECKLDMVLNRNKLIRVGAVSDDLGKYDHGTFHLGANGSQAVAVVGELHVIYDVWLKKPRLNVGGASPAWFYRETSAANAANGAAPFAGASVVTSNNLGVVRATNVFTIPAQYSVSGTVYRMTAIWGGTAANIVKPAFTFVNLTAFSSIFGTADNYSSPSDGVSSARLIVVQDFRVNASNVESKVTVGLAGTVPTGANWDVTISEMS